MKQKPTHKWLQISKTRQTLLWSATWPTSVQSIANEFLANPYKVVIGSLELTANHSITQKFIVLEEKDKYTQLLRLLEKEMDGSRLLTFCDTKKGCDALTRMLRLDGWPALAIHGDKTQQERDWVLKV